MSAISSPVVRLLGAIVLLAAAPVAQAADPAPSLKEIVQTCAACHGPKGVSAIEGTPSIAGQPDIFIQYQLVFIRDGQRKVEAMQEFAKTLTDENIRDLGAYYAKLPPPPRFAGKGKVDVAKVTALLKQRRCENCHKEDFSGQGETGRLAGQRPEYLTKALHDYRSGVRRGRGMGAMLEVSIGLQDDDIAMISEYLARKP